MQTAFKALVILLGFLLLPSCCFPNAGEAASANPVLIVTEDRNNADEPLSPQLAAATDAAILSVPDFAHSLGRQAMSFGSVTALASLTMVVLNPTPGQPNPYAGIDRQHLTRFLLSSLTQEQWKLLGSTTGIGLEDLDDTQKGIYEQLVSQAFRLRQVTAVKGGGYHNEDEAKTLEEPERLQVHLRLTLATEIQPSPAADGQGVLIDGGPTLHDTGETFWALDSVPASDESSQAFGVPLRAEVPNILKPSDLNFRAQAFSAQVSLTVSNPQPSKPFAKTTVGALLQRVAAATQTEVHADKRLTSMALWVHGDSASARDLLQAVCVCVSGAIRQVGPAFVLTDDHAGVGARQAQLADWFADADRQQQELIAQLSQQAVSAAQLATLPLTVNDMLSDDPVLVSRMTAGNDRAFSGAWVKFKMDSLSATERSQVQAYIQRAVDQHQNVRADQVYLGMRLRMTYLVPQIGTVSDIQPDVASLEDMTQTSSETPPDKAPLPSLAAFQSRILFAAPQSVDDVSQAITLGKKQSCDQVWLLVSAPSDLMRWKPALKRQAGLRILAAFSLLQAGENTDNDQDAIDLNISGQTAAEYAASRLRAQNTLGLKPDHFTAQDTQSNWLRANSASVTARWSAFLTAAQAAGLDGIVLQNTSPPGSSESAPPPNTHFLPTIQPDGDNAAAEMGFTLDQRLRYLRLFSVDPIDIAQAQPPVSVDLSLPGFPNNRGESQNWHAFLAAQNQHWMAQVFHNLRSRLPHRPVFLEERSGLRLWFGSWDMPQKLPLLNPYLFTQSQEQQARQASAVVLLNAPCSPDDVTSSQYAQSLAELMNLQQRKDVWNGIVLDLSHVPFSQAATLMSALSFR